MAKTRRYRKNRRSIRGAGQCIGKTACVNNTNRKIQFTTNPVHKKGSENDTHIYELLAKREVLFNAGENTTNIDREIKIEMAKIRNQTRQLKRNVANNERILRGQIQHINKVSKKLDQLLPGTPKFTKEELNKAMKEINELQELNFSKTAGI